MSPDDKQNPSSNDQTSGVIKPQKPAPAGASSPTEPKVNPPSLHGEPPGSPIEPPGRPDDHDGWKSIASTVLLLLLAPLIALSITAFVMQSYQVDGESMETTLQDNDRLIVDKIPRTWARLTHHNYTPNRGDIIIFNQMGLPDSGLSGQKQLIKRVIALPGETVKVSGGKITVYNSQYPHGFNPDQAGLYHITAATTPGEVQPTKLAANEIFVSGDNRPNSEDSRYFGPVNTSQVVGKLVLRLLPVGKIQKF